MKFRVFAIAFLLTIGLSNANAEEAVVLDQYLCADFLKDVGKPDDGISLLRSLMMVSWAAGYAAAYLPRDPRADPKSVQLIAAAVGAACRKAPRQEVLKAFVVSINELLNQQTQASIQPSEARPSLWNYNGSTIYLFADGSSRRLVYETSKDASVKNGTLLFEGHAEGDKYSGIAYASYFNSCKLVPFQMNGRITSDGKVIFLQGEYPTTVTADCKITQSANTVLVFTLVRPSSYNK